MVHTTAKTPVLPPRAGADAPGRPVALAVAGLLFCAYCVVSISRHLRMRTTGYDLGIFEQAVRAYAHLRAPVAPLKGPGFDLLGDHFHPILVLLAPVYRLFPSPITLLVAQAALLASSAVPVTALAVRRLGTPGGAAVGLAYGLSWGLQEAVGFDFHEVCFAVPLLACGLVALVERRWGAVVAWSLPLVLVKEDLPLTVAAIGGYLLVCGRRRAGAALIAVAVAAGALAVLVVIPALNPGHGYPYAATVATGDPDPLRRLLTPPGKLLTMVLLVVPTGFLALRSPVILLAVPTLAWRFWSTNRCFWGTHYHYSAVLMPIVFVALLDALDRVRFASRVPALLLAVALGLSIGRPLRDLTGAAWRVDPRAAAVRAGLHRVPDGATIAASNDLAPQLTTRCEVYLFPAYPDARTRPDWIATDGSPEAPPGYHVVLRQPGLTLLRR